jgi:hypothetical protein
MCGSSLAGCEIFLNPEIINQGHGFAYTRFPVKYMEDFRRYEREAEEKEGVVGGIMAKPMRSLCEEIMKAGEEYG